MHYLAPVMVEYAFALQHMRVSKLYTTIQTQSHLIITCGLYS